MCDKSVDDFLPALKLASGWFVTSEIIKKKTLVMSYFLVMKSIFSVYILIILTLNNYDEHDPETIIRIPLFG